MDTHVVPAPGTLLAHLPTGRDIHTVKPYHPPMLDAAVLEAMRTPPDRLDDFANDQSSDDERGSPAPTSAYPAAADDDDFSGRSLYY